MRVLYVCNWLKDYLFWKFHGKWQKITWKCENWKWPLVCSSPNISASTWPKIKTKDSFEKLRTGTFQNWPYFLNLVKNWQRYSLKQKKEIFWDTLYNKLVPVYIVCKSYWIIFAVMLCCWMSFSGQLIDSLMAII